MSHFDPSASVNSFASTTTEGSATPDASTANLLPPPEGSRSGARMTTLPSPSSQPSTSSAHRTTPPGTRTYLSNPRTPPKDYEQAFATLSIAWGFSAYVPVKNPKGVKTKDKGNKKDKKDKQQRKEGSQKAPQSSPVPSTSSSTS